MGENLTVKYIVYETVNIKNNKIYVGVHKVESEKFDGYLGCGVKVSKPSSYKFGQTPFQRAVSKYGIKSFVRTTIKEFDTLEEALEFEAVVVDEAFVKRKDTYNATLGGGVPPAKTVKVYKYSETGEFIKSYDSIKDASFDVSGGKATGISKAAKNPGKLKMAGFFWSYEKVDKLEIKEKYNKPRKVGKYSKDGQLVKVYDTVRECKKEHSGCVHVLAGQRNHAGGYTFKYID
jgi:hypothetical protein